MESREEEIQDEADRTRIRLHRKLAPGAPEATGVGEEPGGAKQAGGRGCLSQVWL